MMAATVPQGFHCRHLETVGSTNALAFEAARAGEAGGLWITATEQTAGRGRRGRDWVSEPGNLYASLLLIDPCAPRRLGELPLLAAVALAEAIETGCGHRDLVRLKWPNDVLVDGAKLSGILLESERLGDGRLALVAGFGVNCAAHPPTTLYPTTNLRALGLYVEPSRLFEHLADNVAGRLRQWAGGRGFPSIRQEWLRRCVGLGSPVTVRLPDSTLEGRFAGLDDEGRLQLQRNGEMLTISAGDVFFGGTGRPEETT